MKKSIVQSLKGMAFTGVLATGILFAGTGAFATWPSAWTPASVRPAAKMVTALPVKASMASSIAPWTVERRSAAASPGTARRHIRAAGASGAWRSAEHGCPGAAGSRAAARPASSGACRRAGPG